MKANELRIGNWVRSKYPINKEPFQVYQMAFKQMPTTKNHDLDLSSWEPIPLTEDWLIKFGLYNNLKLNYNKPQGVEYRFSKKKLGTYIIKRYYNNSLYNMQFVYDDKHNNIPNEHIWVKIKHVHQLQNLYFALTGKELTIKYEK